MTDAEIRAVKRAVGAAEYAAYLAEFGAEDVADLWAVHGGDAGLVAADMLTTLAAPTLERLRKLGDVTVDTRGQMEAFLDRAAALRDTALIARRAQFGYPAGVILGWGVADGET